MSEYLAKLLNSDHPDRKHVQEVLEEYLFNCDSDGENSDNEINTDNTGTDDDHSDSPSDNDEDVDMTVDQNNLDFQTWKYGNTIVLDDSDEELLKCTNFR